MNCIRNIGSQNIAFKDYHHHSAAKQTATNFLQVQQLAANEARAS